MIFRKEGLLGRGTFGVVQTVCVLKVSKGEEEPAKWSHRFAMKTVHLKSSTSRELMLLRKVNHPNIVKIRFFFFSVCKLSGQRQLNLLFDCLNGTLAAEIEMLQMNEKSWPGDHLAECGRQMIAGLQYLHNLKIAHRDLKPRNILIAGRHLQICDLGSAVCLKENYGKPLSTYVCSR